jgi:DNA adenine methylase
MNARTLLDGLRVRGFRLRTVNGRLAVLPLAGLTEDDRTALRACKDELLALLANGNGRCAPAGAQAEVVISGTTYRYRTRWDGTPLACPTGFLCIDTETDARLPLDGPEVQPLALASASDGTAHALVHPDDLGAFVLAHRGVRWVAHNAAFDFWVAEHHLRRRGEQEALTAWWAAAEDGRLHDSMILDGLLRLARDDSFPRPRDLGVLAEQYAGLAIDKSDPYRMRYGELIGKDWTTAEEGFFSYAIKDSIATIKTYLALREQALDLADAHARVDKDVLPDGRDQFGLLTETVQVRKAIALAAITRNGMCIDRGRLAVGEADLRRRLAEAVAEVVGLCPNLYTVRPDGTLETTPTGGPSRSNTALAEQLEQVVAELAAEGIEVSISLTPKTRKPRASREVWQEYQDLHPFLRPWLVVEHLTKELQFYGHLHEDKVHPKYTTLVRTGRSAASSPNVQQIPKKSDLRTAFVASPGYLLLEIDYRFIELATLAAVCTRRYGKSALGDVIKAGTDPHAFTASMVLGMSLEDFLAWKNDPDRKDAYSENRQAAKAIGFGVPGGLGVKSLVAYAKNTYKATLTEDEAREKREQLLAIYPELQDYLAEDGASILARNLKADPAAVRARWDSLFHLTCVRKVLRDPTPMKEDGAPYKSGFVERIWNTIAALNQDPDLADDLANKRPSKELAARVCLAGVSTLTGRVRGGVSYTQCRNTPFQGLAADGAALALFLLIKAGFRVVGFVHDSFLIELPDLGGYAELATVRQAEEIVRDAMAQVLGCDLPVSVESKLAKRWYPDAGLNVAGDRVYAWAPKGGEPFITLNTPAVPAAQVLKVPVPTPDVEARLAACGAEVEALLAGAAEPEAFPGGADKPLIYYGGKGGHGSKQGKWEIGMFPRHLIYLEAFAGSLGTLFARDPADRSLWVSDKAPRRGVIEIVNDLDGRLINFYRVLRDPDLARLFRRLVERMLVSQREWEAARDHHYDGKNPVLDAWNYYVLNRQCRGGSMSGFAQPAYNRTRGDPVEGDPGMDERPAKWRGALRTLALAHRRLRRVVVTNVPALDLLRRFDKPNVFGYLDPPYVPSTRGAKRVYAREMTYDDHAELVRTLLVLQHAKVMLAGYANALYDGELTPARGWYRCELAVRDAVGAGKKEGPAGEAGKEEKIEVRWLNYDPDQGRPGGELPMTGTNQTTAPFPECVARGRCVLCGDAIVSATAKYCISCFRSCNDGPDKRG